MSGGIIKSSQMAQRGEDTITNASDLSNQINNLVSSVDGLLKVWTSGGGYASFCREYNEERDYLLQFAKSLSLHGEDVVVAARHLDNADQMAAEDAMRIGNIEV